MPDERIRRAYDRIELSAESSARTLSALDNASPGEETNVKKMRKPLGVRKARRHRFPLHARGGRVYEP